MGFKSLIVGAVLVGLVVIALLQGFTSLANENNATNVLMENDIIESRYETINDTLYDLNTTAQAAKENLESDSSNFVTGFFFLNSILNIAKSFTSVLVASLTGVFVMIQSSIGIPPIVTGVFMGILIISLVLAAWRMFKSGQE